MLAIILAGGRGTRTASLSRLPKPLLPLAGKPTIAHIVDELRRHRVTEVCIVVPDRMSGDRYREALGNPRDVYYVVQDVPMGPGHAIAVVAAKMSITYEAPVVVVCADTVFRVDELSRRSTVYTAPAPLEDNFSRWCYVDSDPVWGSVRGFIDKPTHRPHTRDVNIGLYVFGSQRRLITACERIISRATEFVKEIQISEVIEAYGTDQFTALPVREWLDTGTPEAFMRTRRHRFVSRAFNHLELRHGLVAKRSVEKKDKLEDEYDWYRFRQNKRSNFLPPDVRFDRDLGLLTMGYVPYNTASDRYLFDLNLDAKSFAKFLFRVWDEVDAPEEATNSLHRLIVEKTDKRVGGMKGLLAQAVSRVWGKYRPLVVDKVAKMTPMPGLFHGDLNLTNILVDKDLRDYVVVDPRGEPLGDRRYDLAKIAHSLWGYDHIINGLYWSEPLTPHFTPIQNEVQYEFKETLRKAGLLEDVIIITGVLFISLIPFHAEDEKRQRAFLDLAEQILGSVE